MNGPSDNKLFLESFDFIKDLAIENPGESSVLKLSFEQKVMDHRATDFLPFFGTDIGKFKGHYEITSKCSKYQFISQRDMHPFISICIKNSVNLSFINFSSKFKKKCH